METNIFISQSALTSVARSKMACCQFITWPSLAALSRYPDELILSSRAWPLLFGGKAYNNAYRARTVHILWQGQTLRKHKFIWRGSDLQQVTLTNFSAATTSSYENLLGSLLVLATNDKHAYEGWILTTDDELEDFLSALAMTPADIDYWIKA